MVLRGCGAPPSPGRAASGRLGWRRPQNSIPAALQGPGPRPHNDSGPRPSAIELGRGDGAHSASPHSPGRQVDDGERPPQPRLGLRSLSHAALPGLTAGYGNSGAPASVFCGGVSQLPTAQAAASLSLRTMAQWHTTPTPPASHVTQRIMTKGPRHVGVAAPPSSSESQAPPRGGGGLSAPGLSPPGVLPPPGPVLSLPSPHGPSPPSGTSRQPLGLCWLSQQPWAHHRPMAWHPPACHHPLSPPLSSQPGQDSLGEMQRALPAGARLPVLQGQQREGTAQCL